VVVFKVVFNNRMETPPSFPRYFLDLIYHMIRPRIGEQDWGFNISQFIGVDLIDRGLKLPLLAVEALLRPYIGKPQAAITGALGILVFFYIYRIAPRDPDRWFCRREWRWMIAAGLAAALAGYAIFFLVWNVQFTFAGVANRVSMSAAPGLAVSFVGLMGFAVSQRSLDSFRPAGFASLVALFAASGCLVNYAIASFWIAASDRQPAILAAIQNRFPTFPKGSTLILDGACPNVGPGIENGLPSDCHPLDEGVGIPIF
jgi:hypothetical protein